MLRSCRSFATSALSWAPKASKGDDTKKNALKKMAMKRIKAKQPAYTSPLYATIPEALRYLRASEVGRSPEEAVISMAINIVSERGTTPVSGSISLPKPLKETRILVFTNDPEKAKEALESGAHMAGGAELVDKIMDGSASTDYDKSFATPDIVPQLSKIARKLGPKGLMPSVKKGTVTTELDQVIRESAGTLPFKQKSELLSIPIGRVHYTDSEILSNVIAARDTIKSSIGLIKTKKPIIVGQTTITSTHGPGLVIDF